MIVLGIDSSTSVASVALVEDGCLRGEITVNIGLTHSEQLLPLIDDVLVQTKMKLQDVTGIAVASGPGSFTGLRIGMATAKGLAQGGKILLTGVPTLLALAYTMKGCSGLVSPVLNARKQEVYTTLFRFGGEKTEQLVPYRAVCPQEWVKELSSYGEPVVLVGDGTMVYADIWEEVLGQNAFLPLPGVLQARAATVAWLGEKRLREEGGEDIYSLKPMYLRPSEAEARLKKRG